MNSFIILPDGISAVIDFKPFNISSSHPNYDEIVEALKRDDFEAVEELYLLLGEAKETDRFVTTLKVEQPTETIIKLVDNSNKYKFTPLEVSHEIKGGKGLPEIRVIKDISIINE